MKKEREKTAQVPMMLVQQASPSLFFLQDVLASLFFLLFHKMNVLVHLLNVFGLYRSLSEHPRSQNEHSHFEMVMRLLFVNVLLKFVQYVNV